jgi:ATP phosphoribosyltransferase
MPERESAPISIAIPKGRVLPALLSLLSDAGLDAPTLRPEDRRLVHEPKGGRARYLLLKPDDVPTYVEYGAADIGVVGRDVLLEREYDLYAPVDLGIGRCRMVVAALSSPTPAPSRPLRVATKYPSIAARHFAAKGQRVETIYVSGSVELAPIAGLADLVVDLVESGETLRRNGLVEIETVCAVTTVVVANRAGLKLRHAEIGPWLEALERAAREASA